MSKLYVGDNNLSKEGKKIYIGYNNIAVALPVSKPKVYGVAWDGGSSPIFTRTDDAANFPDPNPYYADMTGTPSSPFDNISPWKDMVISEDANAGTVVSIPKYYYKIAYASGTTGLVIKIAPASNGADWATENGYLCSPAHRDRGDGAGERDVIYVGRYHCSVSNYKSETGWTPYYSARSYMRTNIHNLGSNVWLWDFFTLQTIWFLYLVEFANWDSQRKIGIGGYNGATGVWEEGRTDLMPYHTGTMNTDKTLASKRGVQYRNIESLWDNSYNIVDGCYISSRNTSYSYFYLISNPMNFNDTSGGTLITNSFPKKGSYISKFAISSTTGFEGLLYPNVISGSDSTYICDGFRGQISDNKVKVLSIGGDYQPDYESGLFNWYSNLTYNSSGRNMGARLMILP